MEAEGIAENVQVEVLQRGYGGIGNRSDYEGVNTQ